MILYQTPWNTKHGFKIVLHFIFLISAIFPDIFHTLFEFFWENKKLSDGIFILFSARIKEHFYITFYNPGAAFFKIDALKNLQNLQENICARVSFLITLQGWSLELILKETLVQVFPMNFVKFLKTPFL